MSGNVYTEVKLAPLQGQTNFVFEEWLSQYDRNRKPKSGFHYRRLGFYTPKGVQGLHGVGLSVTGTGKGKGVPVHAFNAYRRST